MPTRVSELDWAQLTLQIVLSLQNALGEGTMETGNHLSTVAAIAVAFLFLAISGLARATATASPGTRMRRLVFIVAFLLWAMPSSLWAACSGASMELCQNVTGHQTTANPTQAITVTNTGDALIVMGAAWQTSS